MSTDTKSRTPVNSDANVIPADSAPAQLVLSDQSTAEYLTRRQAADYIHIVLGRPFSFSTAAKLAALGEFAQPAVWWGRRPLYTREGRPRMGGVEGQPDPADKAGGRFMRAVAKPWPASKAFVRITLPGQSRKIDARPAIDHA
jgi:hypothetical protein